MRSGSGSPSSDLSTGARWAVSPRAVVGTLVSMELRGNDVPVDDPFFAPVRARHPDVDIVVLPAPTTPPAGSGPDGETHLDAPDPTEALARVEAATRPLLTALDAPQGTHPETTFRFGVEEGVVRATAAAVAHLEHGAVALDRLHHLLLAHGWEVLRPAGGVPRITGAHEGLSVTASYAAATQTFLLTVSSEPLPVGVVDARALVAGRAERPERR